MKLNLGKRKIAMTLLVKFVQSASNNIKKDKTSKSCHSAVTITMRSKVSFFKFRCIKQWFEYKEICPNCNRNVKDSIKKVKLEEEIMNA
jgi:hypothetical protein